MSLREEQHAFYAEQVPTHFNRAYETVARHASQDPEAERLLEEMTAVRTAIRIDVDTEAGAETHWLEIERGRMRPSEGGGLRPFFILSHAIDDFRSIARECGVSVLGFLGALAGLDEEMKLTAQRVRSLRELAGSIRFEVEGPKGFSLVASFGLETPEAEPRAWIRLTPEIFEALRSGALDAQSAFFEEKIEVEGDLELAIGMALAALSPD